MTDRLPAAARFKAAWLDYIDALGHAAADVVARLWCAVQIARWIWREVCVA